jgi:hypothetical protein
MCPKMLFFVKTVMFVSTLNLIFFYFAFLFVFLYQVNQSRAMEKKSPLNGKCHFFGVLSGVGGV